jgi:hypothetical protein
MDGWPTIGRLDWPPGPNGAMPRAVRLRSVPLEGQWERQNTPLAAMTRREIRVLLVSAATVVVVLAVVIVAAVAGSHPVASAGCHRETVAMSTGGATIERCDH